MPRTDKQDHEIFRWMDYAFLEEPEYIMQEEVMPTVGYWGVLFQTEIAVSIFI